MGTFRVVEGKIQETPFLFYMCLYDDGPVWVTLLNVLLTPTNN